MPRAAGTVVATIGSVLLSERAELVALDVYQSAVGQPVTRSMAERLLFTDIVESTRRGVEIGDRDWHALLDAHDAVV